MNLDRRHLSTLAFILGCLPFQALAADADILSAQRKALEPLSFLDGHWRGKAKILTREGKEMELTQTERVGSFLGGTVRLIEGRGYAADGTLQFNAFGVISWSPRAQKYNFRAYAQGNEGDFPMEVRPDGFAWSIKAGPATIRYTATVKGDTWDQIGERLVEGQPAMRIFEMNLRRIGKTGWPQDGVVGPK